MRITVAIDQLVIYGALPEGESAGTIRDALVKELIARLGSGLLPVPTSSDRVPDSAVGADRYYVADRSGLSVGQRIALEVQKELRR